MKTTIMDIQLIKADTHSHATKNRQACLTLDPTTSFLTATNLIFAIGAGITAAAGTRLALQLVLVKGFKLYSFRLTSLIRVHHRYLNSLPPRSESG